MSALPMHEPLFRAGADRPIPRVLLPLSLCLALGLVVQAFVLLAMAWQGTLPQAPRLLADAARLLVGCAGTGLALTVGAGAAKGRSGVAACIGLLGAPAAFLLARSVQTTALGALIGVDIHGATPWVGAALHGLSYGLLGGLLPVLALRGAGALAHACTGAALGGLGFAIGLAAMPAAGDVLPRAIAEIGIAASIALAVFLAPRIWRRQA